MSLNDSLVAYEYTQLKSAEIRVLDLLSAPGEELKCRLRSTELPANSLGTATSSSNISPSYVALSYVWGSPVRTFAIKVADSSEGLVGEIPLTVNLHNALKDLRDAPHIQPKTFWIDQICINQDDIDEKSHQVAKMSKIYSSASCVVTYLGPEAQGDSAAIQLLGCLQQWYEEKASMRQGPDPNSALIYPHLRQMYLNPLQATVLLLYPTEEHIPLDLRFPLTADDRASCKHVRRLVDAYGWYTRAWMFQENLLNPSTGFLRGPRYIPWAHLSVWAFLTTAGLVPESPCLPLTMLHEWRHRRSQKEFNRLFFLLSFGRNFLSCQDERDKIYALLGVASDADELQIQPDYHKSVTQVYTDLVVSYIRSRRAGHGKLLILEKIDQEPLMLQGEEGNKEQEQEQEQEALSWPSWVPRFKFESYLHSTKDPDSRLAGCLHPSCPPERFDESITFEPGPWPAAVENAILVVEGLGLSKLGVCLGTMGTILNGPRPPEYLKQTLATLNQAVDVLESNNIHVADSSSNAAPSPRLALCRAMLMDDDWPFPSDLESSNDASAQSHATAAFNNLRHVLNSECNGVHVVTREGSTVMRPEAHPDLLHSTGYIIAHSLGIKGRALWVLQDGRVALAPSCVRRGDVPVLLPVDRWVYFLRPCGDDQDRGNNKYYKYLGWGYVHGVMNGKIFEAEDSEDWEGMVQTFRIR